MCQLHDITTQKPKRTRYISIYSTSLRYTIIPYLYKYLYGMYSVQLYTHKMSQPQQNVKNQRILFASFAVMENIQIFSSFDVFLRRYLTFLQHFPGRFDSFFFFLCAHIAVVVLQNGKKKTQRKKKTDCCRHRLFLSKLF